MSKPWADVREMLDKAAVQIKPTSLTLDGRALRDLLTDAEALLAAVRELAPHAKDAYIDDFGDWYDDDFWRRWLGRNYPALAALPEHLRG